DASLQLLPRPPLPPPSAIPLPAALPIYPRLRLARRRGAGASPARLRLPLEALRQRAGASPGGARDRAARRRAAHEDPPRAAPLRPLARAADAAQRHHGVLGHPARRGRGEPLR